MVIFTVIEGIVGLFIIFGLFTRIMSIGVFGLALGILLGSGWIGTTCLDEWQIGVLGIATGFVLFLTGSGQYSLDNYMMRKDLSITKKAWFPWIASGKLPIKEHILPKIVLLGSILILGITLMTNQIYHGGVWGTLHNKSVKPKLEISDARIEGNQLSFDVFRIEGVDVYGSWVIGIELYNAQDEAVLNYNQSDLALLDEDNISNYYVAKVKPGKHSMVIPLGAKARLNLKNQVLGNLPTGIYTIKITDISGVFWEYKLEI